LVLESQFSYAPQLARGEPVRVGKLHRLEPELGLAVPLLDVDVGRLLPLAALEEEAKAFDPEQRGHAVFLQPSRVP
jgi:hypothetical protein